MPSPSQHPWCKVTYALLSCIIRYVISVILHYPFSDPLKLSNTLFLNIWKLLLKDVQTIFGRMRWALFNSYFWSHTMVEVKIIQPKYDPWRALDEKVNWKMRDEHQTARLHPQCFIIMVIIPSNHARICNYSLQNMSYLHVYITH